MSALGKEQVPHCRWCKARVLPNLPCSCARAQEEARRIRVGGRL